MKTCSSCEKYKPVSEFYNNKKNKDGLFYRCKSCIQEYHKSDRARANKAKFKRSVKGKALDAKYKRSSKGRANTDRSVKKWRAANPEGRKAQSVIAHMVEAGELHKASTKICWNCGKQASDHHHPNYDRPKMVVPLCRPCHREAHT